MLEAGGSTCGPGVSPVFSPPRRRCHEVSRDDCRGLLSAIRLRRAAQLLTALTLVLAVAGCDDSAATKPATSPADRHITLVGESQADPAWDVLKASADRFERENPRFKVRVVAPMTASPTDQQKLLMSLIDGDTQVVCLMPSDARALRPAIQKLSTGGRPVITIGLDVPTSNRAAYSGPSEIEIGRQAAAACALALEGRSTSAITLHAGEDDESRRVRRYAFAEELGMLGQYLIIREVDCGGNPLDAAQRMRVESEKYPRVGCWVLFDDWPLRVTPVRERILPLGCRIVLCHGSPLHVERVRRGEVQALIAYDLHESIANALNAARNLIDAPTYQLPEFSMAETYTITVSELDWYERCWMNWRRGLPSPPETPWE